MFNATLEPNGMIAIWSPDGNFPVLEITVHEAEQLLTELLGAVSDARWVQL